MAFIFFPEIKAAASIAVIGAASGKEAKKDDENV